MVKHDSDAVRSQYTAYGQNKPLQQLQTCSAANPVTNASFNMIGKLVSVLAGPEAHGSSAVGQSVNHPIHFGPDKIFKLKLIQIYKFFSWWIEHFVIPSCRTIIK